MTTGAIYDFLVVVVPMILGIVAGWVLGFARGVGTEQKREIKERVTAHFSLLAQPDLEPTREPLIPVAAEIICPNCGYTILTYDRELTSAEVRDGLDRKISDLQQTVQRLTHELEGRGYAV